MIERFLSPELVHALGWTLIHTLWQAAVFALLLGGMLVLLRKYSALTRYCVAIGTLATFFLTAGLTFTALYEKPVTELSLTATHHPQQPTYAAVPLPVKKLSTTSPIQSAAILSLRERFVTYYDEHLPLIVTLWLLGVLILQLRFLGQLAYLQRLKSYGTERFPVRFTPLLRELEANIGLAKPVRYLRSFRVGSPFTTGWIRPVVMFPTKLLEELTDGELRTILAHELAHVKRYDFLVNLGQTLFCLLFFYHPAVWWMSARVEEEREHCCDDLAIATTGEKVGYAKTLLRMKETELAGTGLAMAFGGRGHGFHHRIQRLFSGYLGTSTYGEGFTTAVIIACCIGLALTFSDKENGARPQVQGLTETTAAGDFNLFMDAIYEGNLEMVVRFLEQTAPDLSREDDRSFTPLIAAASKDRAAIVRLLLEAGAEVNQLNSKGWTALIEAADENALATAKVLLEAGAAPNLKGRNNSRTALAMAASEGHPVMISLLVQAGASIFFDANNAGPLHEAADEGQLQVVKTLLQLGADVNATDLGGRTPLSYAAEERRTAVVQTLLEHGANPGIADNYGRYPIEYAVEEGANGAFRLLTKAMEDGSNCGPIQLNTAKQIDLLITSAREGKLRLVQQLIDTLGIDPDAVDTKGNSALTMAAREDEAKVVRYLLSKGALVNGPEGSNTQRPLIYAARKNAESAISLLLEAGADLEIDYNYPELDNMGNENPYAFTEIAFYRKVTPLMIALTERNPATTKMLLDAGANVNARAFKHRMTTKRSFDYRELENIGRVEMLRQSDERYEADGWTPLMEAVESGNPRLVELLLQYGANPDAITRQGMTASAIATTMGLSDIAAMLP